MQRPHGANAKRLQRRRGQGLPARAAQTKAVLDSCSPRHISTKSTLVVLKYVVDVPLLGTRHRCPCAVDATSDLQLLTGSQLS